MRSAILTLSERRERALQNQDGFRRFLKGEGPDRLNHGDLEFAGEELIVRLASNVRQSRAMRRALSAELETAGPSLVPETFADCFEQALLYASPLRDWATVVSTERGGEWRLPTVDDTAIGGSVFGENQLPSTTDVTTFGSITLQTHKFSSNWLSVSQELAEDVTGLVEQKLAGVIGRRIGRLQNSFFAPQILAQAMLGVTTASPTAIAGDEVMNLFFSIDPAYRESQGFCWQLNNGTLQAVRELKDASGRYLFKTRRNSADEPDLLLGKPIAVNRDMASIAANNITIACGDFSKVVFRDVGREVRLRIAGERWADFDQVGVVGFLRSDAALADAGTHPIKYLQQHS